MSIEKGGSKGGSEPAPNPEDEGSLKKSGLVYRDDKIGSSHLRTKDGRVPTDEELSQFSAKEVRKYREKSLENGSSGPAPNLGSVKLLEEFGLEYKEGKDGKIRLLTKDGRVPTDEELRQYAAKGFEKHKKMLESIRQKGDKNRRRKK